MKGMMGIGRIARGSFVTLASLFALVLAFGPAFAATIVVPTDFITIQGAVDAASSGDTIVVKKGGGPGPNGEYHEAVDIDDDDITIKCEKGAVIDGAIPSDAPGGPTRLMGPGIDVIDSDDVTVDGCTVQNFDGRGINVSEDGDDATIVNNTLVNNTGDGLHIDGDNFVVRNNTAIRNGFGGSDGFELHFGDDGTVIGNVAIANNDDGFDLGNSDDKRYIILRNRANKNKDDGFNIEGDFHTVRGNRAELNEDDGFDFESSPDVNIVEHNLARGNDDDGFELEDVEDSTIRRNVAINNEDEGFDLDDDGEGGFHGNLIERNIAIGNENQGFKIRGDRNTVTNNRAIENKDDGFRLNCNEDGPDPDDTCTMEITNNRSLRSTDNGFELSDFDKSSVYENTAIGNEDNGFECGTCEDVVFSNNLARDNGENGFQDFRGGKNTYKGNRSIGNGGDGFQINDALTSTMSLIKNTARKNFADGIDINDGSVDYIIDGNIVKNNRGTGIESDGGSDAVIKNNTMKGNRTDLAGKGDDDTISPECDGSAGAATDGGGNTFVTGGFDVCTPGTGAGDFP